MESCSCPFDECNSNIHSLFSFVLPSAKSPGKYVSLLVSAVRCRSDGVQCILLLIQWKQLSNASRSGDTKWSEMLQQSQITNLCGSIITLLCRNIDYFLFSYFPGIFLFFWMTGTGKSNPRIGSPNTIISGGQECNY